MSSSPPRSALNTPSRTPLQERTQSQANEISSRLLRNPKLESAGQNVYSASPFPTKPQHVLLPSTIKKQKSGRNLGAGRFNPDYSAESQVPPTTPRRPPVRLKKSVKTLRDMYEAAQSEDSRPSSALSGGILSRPGSANSRLRSFSSNEGMSGRFAWEQFNKPRANDDMALLPSLPEGQATLRQIGSNSSFAARSGLLDPSSSPNVQVLGATSSPQAPRHRFIAEPSSETSDDFTSDPNAVEQTSSSSPNFRRHATSSSIEEPPSMDESSSPNLVKLGTSSPTQSVIRLAPHSSNEDLPTDPLSSPNFVKLGTSSPARTLRGYEESSPLQRQASASSSSSRKRKRSDPEEGLPFFARAGVENPFPPSSPPDAIENNASQSSFHSSPPVAPLVRSKSVLSPDVSSVLEAPYEYSMYDQSSIADTHTTLQAALSSSPAPRIQYPVVRAPAPAHVAGLMIPKRNNRSSMTSETIMTPRWPSRLSAVPSDASLRSEKSSKRSSIWDDTDEQLDSDEIGPAAAYLMSEGATGSQIRFIPEYERHDEADDLVGDLPGDEYGYRSPPIIRTSSFGATPNSSHSRLGSFQSSLDNQLNSLTSRRGSLRRPSSSGSLASVAAVPTWAKRYYSGIYQDSFRSFMQSSSMVNVTQVTPPQQKPLPSRPESISTTVTGDTPRSSRRSFASMRQSLEKIPSLIRAKRPRLEARKSHLMPGLGPLVSNPVRGPATAAIISPKPSQPYMRSNLRPMSFPLHPADPRSQWAGYSELRNTMHQSSASAPLASGGLPYTIPPRRMGRLPSISPHLHHDHRLNTGSTASRGYGHRRNRYSNPSDMFFDEKAGPGPGNSLRTGQLICFIIGFVCPLAWFVGAVLPLPKRPDTFMDIEKSTWRRASQHGDLTEYEAMDVLAGLRKERRRRGGEESSWQNARWWRALNRWMCIVGTVVMVLVIVLAVIGTKNKGLS